MIKAIIFDMDGLMIDSEKLYMKAEIELAASFGKTVPSETLRNMMGRKTLDSLEIYKKDLGLSVSAQELADIREVRVLQMLKENTEPMKGLFEIIDTFYNQLDLAIATGSTKAIADIAIDSLKLTDKFKLIQTCDNILKGKPDPEIYLTVVSKLKLEPFECVVLEDSENGILAGKRAGCYVIAVPNEHTVSHNLSPADWVVSDLFEACEIIKKHL